jgi:hypothetical protein
MMIKERHACISKRVKRIITVYLCTGLVLWVGRMAFALPESENYQAEMGGFSSKSAWFTLLDILFLMGILTCFFISVKVKSFLRDGELASGWTLFSLSFVLLFIAQLLSLSLNINLFNIPLSLVSIIRLLSIFTLASGIYFMKRVLS